jgi:hypothetical protein
MALPTPFTPFEIKWDAPQLPGAALHDIWSSFEWWYFDLSTDDGVELVVVFSRKNPIFSSDKVSVYVEYTAPGTAFKHIRNYAPSQYAYADWSDTRELEIGGNAVRIVGTEPASMHYEVTLDLPWITGTLRMTPQHRGFLPSADGHYFTGRSDPSLYTAVSFSAPIMETTGTLTVGGKSQAVNGRGYHDHPWGTQQLFWTHREWHWGRTTTPKLGVMFATVTPASEFDGALTFLWSGATGEFEPQVTAALTVTPSQWKKRSLVGIDFPHELAVAVPGLAWTSQFENSLLDTPMYERSAVSWTPVPPDSAGSGWTEYFSLPPLLRWMAFLGARIAAFFWRPFPWIGR